QYITPSLVVKYVLDAVGYKYDGDILEKRLIDPACGSGIFLLEAVRVYLATLRRCGVPIVEWYQRVRNSFVGLDVDPLACLYTRFNLGLLLTPSILFWTESNLDAFQLPSLPVFCVDTLKTMSNEIGGGCFFSKDPPRLNLMNNFDFVIGNPPYHKIRNLDNQLRIVFQKSLFGHPNAYGLFLHSGIEMLRPVGSLGYIIPKSMLSGLYFKNLRRFIERRAVLREITLITDRKNVFGNVLQGTMILVVTKKIQDDNPRDSLHFTVKTGIARSTSDFEKKQFNSVNVDQKHIVQFVNGTSIWFVSNKMRSYEIIKKLLTSNPLMSSPEVGCLAKTGPIVWNRVEAILSTTRKIDTLPLVWATDVGRFFFKHGACEDDRATYLQNNSRTQGLRSIGVCLLLQRVTADEQPYRLVGCVPESFCSIHSEGYFVENHLNIIQPRPGASPIDLYYLLGITCSNVMEFFFRSMNGNTQVSATELNLMPIPRGRCEKEIAALAHQLQETVESDNRFLIEKKLNIEVAEAYGLRPDELVFIQETLSDLRKR
ncbi:MAG TPA: Eco57I restriction-modification methylase domain-containing protein, partial [Chryseolinea sp.]|nr:Eco57I restriction-modification methylase domain-containing protein [Chryseolinea sp.]